MFNLPSRSSDAGPDTLEVDSETGCTEQEMRQDVDPCALREKIFLPFPRRDPSTFLSDLETHDRSCFLCISLRADDARESAREQARELRRIDDARDDERLALALRMYVTMELCGGMS